jgi:hypothetical protein
MLLMVIFGHQRAFFVVSFGPSPTSLKSINVTVDDRRPVQGLWEETMKYLGAFCLLFIFGVAAASAQVAGGALSAQPQIFEIPSHPQRAAQQALGREESLLETLTITSAKGERPLWEAPQQVTYVMPLGDVARLFRKEHEVAKKAVLVKEN